MALLKRNFIHSISVSELAYPLYDHLVNPALLFYDVGEKIIYGPTQKQAYPAALDTNTTIRVELRCIRTDHDRMSNACKLAANLNGATVFKAPIDPTKFEIIENGLIVSLTLQPLLLEQPLVDGRPKALPWLLRGDLEWMLDDPNHAGGGYHLRYCTETPIELYVFPPNLPDFFQKGGIPLPLLRLEAYLPKWMQLSSWEQISPRTFVRSHPTPHDIELNWVSFAVHALFPTPWLRYENWSGTYRYLSFEGRTIRELFAKNRGFDCWLDLWLFESQPRFIRQGISVNCYDLAALCQVLVALGVDTQSQELRMKYMEPFGLIKSTYLIGRFEQTPKPENPNSLCNNPFYGDDRRFDSLMLCNANSPSRSGFGNHMFLTLGSKLGQPNVLDACCGPQLGTVPLTDYPQTVIDELSVPRGSVADITDGPGVQSLVTSRCFGRHHDSQNTPPQPTLFDWVAYSLRNEGTLTEPHLTVPADSRSITVRWYLERPPGDHEWIPVSDLITIDVFKFTNVFDLNHDYNLREATLSAWVPSAVGGLECSKSAFSVLGSRRMFKNERNLYLAIIETMKIGLPDTITLKHGLENVLNDAFSCTVDLSQYIANVITQPSDLPQPVGTRFIVSLQVIIAGWQNWKGFNVAITRGNVLFVGATATVGVIAFEFLARTPGYDTAIITLYGGRLETGSRTVNFWISNKS